MFTRGLGDEEVISELDSGEKIKDGGDEIVMSSSSLFSRLTTFEVIDLSLSPLFFLFRQFF